MFLRSLLRTRAKLGPGMSKPMLLGSCRLIQINASRSCPYSRVSQKDEKQKSWACIF